MEFTQLANDDLNGDDDALVGTLADFIHSGRDGGDRMRINSAVAKTANGPCGGLAARWWISTNSISRW